MIYSVWNMADRRYDYFATAEKNGDAHAPAPRHVRDSSQLGATVRTAAWRLPMGAKKVGAGELARGRVAIAGFSEGAIPWKLIAVGVVLAYGASRWLR